MKRNRKITGHRGQWYVSIEGVEGQHAAVGRDRLNRATMQVSLHEGRDTEKRHEQIARMKETGILILNDYDSETKTSSNARAVAFRGRVIETNGARCFQIEERL